MSEFKKTKIIATLGPSSNNPEIISEMISAGMNVARINMSHFQNTFDFENLVKIIRSESDKLKIHIGILVDLAGPKIRLNLDSVNNNQFTMKANEIYTLGYGSQNDLPINCNIKFNQIIKKKSYIKINDGKTILEIIKNDTDRLFVKSLNETVLENRKGVNFPDIDIDINPVTENDKKHILLAIKNNVDWLALSFVRKNTDINPIIDIFKKENHYIPIIAKIEKPEAILNLKSIIDTFNGILIARGDLGVEVPLAELPGLQKKIIEDCRKSKKPVIVATQMLESMIENSSPTRAEVNDVANAVYESADAVMLSGETAIGQYPVESIRIMNDILLNAEHEIFKNKISENISIEVDQDTRSAIGEAVKLISNHLNIDAIVVMTESGNTGIIVSHYRPKNQIFALTPNKSICNKLSLVWGIVPILTKEFKSTDEMIKQSQKILVENSLLKLGCTFVLTAGVPIGISSSTNMLKIHKIENN